MGGVSEGEWEGSVWGKGGVSVDEEKRKKQSQCGRNRNQAVSNLTRCKCTLLIWRALCTAGLGKRSFLS